MLIALVFAACGGGDNTDEATSAAPTTSTVISTPAEAQQAIVRVELLVTDGTSATVRYWGTGAFVGPGLVLTSGRLLDPEGGWDTIGIAPVGPDGRFAIAYQADVVAIDPWLDVAVLRIAADREGREIDPEAVPSPALAPAAGATPDSGEALGIGALDAGVPSRSQLSFTVGVDGETNWIEADSTLPAGFGGAPVLDDNGRIVGIVALPEPQDDRAFIRRIEEAMPLIAAATDGDSLILSGRERLPPPDRRGADLPQDLSIDNAALYSAVQDGQPVGPTSSFASGTTRIVYAFDYEGMRPGTPWLDEWRVNGEVDPQLSPPRPGWDRGSSGTLVSSISDPNGLPDGVYELRILVRGLVVASVETTVGDEPSVSSFERLRIAPDVSGDGQPLGQAERLEDPRALYAFFDYRGLQPGGTWEYVWYHDDAPILESAPRAWRGGSSGRDWWVAFYRPNGAALAPGTYSVRLLIEGEVAATAEVDVAGSPT